MVLYIKMSSFAIVELRNLDKLNDLNESNKEVFEDDEFIMAFDG